MLLSNSILVRGSFFFRNSEWELPELTAGLRSSARLSWHTKIIVHAVHTTWTFSRTRRDCFITVTIPLADLSGSDFILWNQRESTAIRLILYEPKSTMCRSMVDIQSATAKIRWGKKEERRKKQDENIMSASATQGGHKMVSASSTELAFSFSRLLNSGEESRILEGGFLRGWTRGRNSRGKAPVRVWWTLFPEANDLLQIINRLLQWCTL